MNLKNLFVIFILFITLGGCKKQMVKDSDITFKMLNFGEFKKQNNMFFKLRNNKTENRIQALSINSQDDNLLQELSAYVESESGYYGTTTFNNILHHDIQLTLPEFTTAINLPNQIDIYDSEIAQKVNNAVSALTDLEEIIEYDNNLPIAIQNELKRININIKNLGLNLINEYSLTEDEPLEGDMYIYNTLKFSLEEQANSLYNVINSSNELDYNSKQTLLFQALTIKDNFEIETQNAAIQGFRDFSSSQNVIVTSYGASPIKTMGIGRFLKKVIKFVAKVIVIAVVFIIAATILSLSGDLGDILFPKNEYARGGVVLAGLFGGLYLAFEFGRRSFNWIDSW